MKQSLLYVFFVLLITSTAFAQQPTDTKAPTMPGKGNWVFRSIFAHHVFDPSEQSSLDGSKTMLLNHMELGLSGHTALMFHVIETWENVDGVKNASGLEDSMLTFKWRFYQNDFGPISTTRFGLLTGLELPTGSDVYTTGSVSPHVALSAMHIDGRHGVTASLMYHITQGDHLNPILAGEKDANHLSFDASYLYRIAPAIYGESMEAAWYVGTELNGDWETDGDAELILRPILLYEAPAWAFELTYGLPVYEDVEHRPEIDSEFKFGLRFLF
ncbi:MAG: hypothetical protein VX436_01060 [Planctomycetota bacterium]|nr:hypothetical protein [Planctomycetota bacterium]